MFNKLKKNGKKGFTLIEILIVIALLGVVATIAVPRFTSVLSESKIKADVAAIQLWAKEVEASYMVGLYTKGTDGAVTEENIKLKTPFPTISGGGTITASINGTKTLIITLSNYTKGTGTNKTEVWNRVIATVE